MNQRTYLVTFLMAGGGDDADPRVYGGGPYLAPVKVTGRIENDTDAIEAARARLADPTDARQACVVEIDDATSTFYCGPLDD